MRPGYVVAAVLAVIAALVCAGVALHEYDYFRSHPGRTGVSGVLIWLAVGAFLSSAAVAVLAVTAGRVAARADLRHLSEKVER